MRRFASIAAASAASRQRLFRDVDEIEFDEIYPSAGLPIRSSPRSRRQGIESYAALSKVGYFASSNARLSTGRLQVLISNFLRGEEEAIGFIIGNQLRKSAAYVSCKVSAEYGL